MGLIEALRRALLDASHPSNIDGAGCLLLDGDGALRFAAASNTVAETLEVAEAVCVEGPCHEAFAGEDVTYADVQKEERWERLRALLATSPIRTVIGVPILLDGRSIGALNVFSALPTTWGEADFVGMHEAAGVITSLIERALDARLDDEGDELTLQLRAALANRGRLREAADVLMDGAGLDRATALLHIRQLAAASDQAAVAVAEQVLANQGMPSPSSLAEQAEQVRSAREENARLALTDPLTGLANRALFLDHLEQALARADRSGHHPAVVFIDLDRFKTINDSLGHAAGDEVLRRVAIRLKDEVRAQDTVARLGGDEFAVLYDAPSRAEVVEQLAQRLATAVSVPIELPVRVAHGTRSASYEVSVHASLGVAVIDAPECRVASDILRDADMAMYEAKASGGNRIRVFTESVRQKGHRVMQVELSLRSLLEAQREPASDGTGRLPDGIRLAYQPIIDLDSGRIDTVEALVRWHHPELGELTAQEIIAAAENAGVITLFGDLLLHEACTAAVAWRELPGAPDLIVAVNVSPLQLHDPGFVERVRVALETAELEAGRLCLELTESQLLTSAGASATSLHELHELGVRLTIDDFGTGYSSLSYLAALPIDRIKLDRTFIAGLTVGSRADAVARAVIGLGRSLEMETVAEGIETPEQAGYAIDLACGLAQGFLFSVPLEADRIPALLQGGGLDVDRWRPARSPARSPA